MIKVQNTVTVYEVDGKEIGGINGPTLSVKSHWLRPSLVVLEVDGKALTVVADDLRAAIANATNSGHR